MNDAGHRDRRDDRPPDAVRRRGHAAEQPHPQGHPVRLLDRRGGGHPAREEQRDVHERLDPRRREDATSRPSCSSGRRSRSCGGRPTSRRRSGRRGSCGRTTTRATRGCAARWRHSPRTRPATRRSPRRTATWPSGASTTSTRGRSTCESAVRLMASSPINRPHACDGKVTDAAMAEKLVFMAHQGKVTLREKFPAAGSRRMPDLPGAVPHLTYGYATFSPIVIAEQLKAARAARADGEGEGARPRPRRRRWPTATRSRATTCGAARSSPRPTPTTGSSRAARRTGRSCAACRRRPPIGPTRSPGLSAASGAGSRTSRRARRTWPRRRAASPTTATRRPSSPGSRARSPSTSCASSPGTRPSSPS